jgi:hypothetical protein
MMKARAFLGALALSMGACSEADPSTPAECDPPLSVVIAQTDLVVGDSTRLTAVGVCDDEASVSWLNSAPEVVGIQPRDRLGAVARALRPGQAQLRLVVARDTFLDIVAVLRVTAGSASTLEVSFGPKWVSWISGGAKQTSAVPISQATADGR